MDGQPTSDATDREVRHERLSRTERELSSILALMSSSARVIDLRWLAPVDADALLAAVGPCGRVLIVDECRVTGSQSEALMALFAEQAPHIRASRIAAEDSFIPLGRAATLTLPGRDSIVAAALEAVRG